MEKSKARPIKTTPIYKIKVVRNFAMEAVTRYLNYPEGTCSYYLRHLYVDVLDHNRAVLDRYQKARLGAAGRWFEIQVRKLGSPANVLEMEIVFTIEDHWIRELYGQG